jgi:putative Mg2+ transporter-C (MgtC) family protein
MDASAEFITLGKIILAGFLGGLVGLEREAADKPAGLRTHMLVCGTSTLFVALAPVVSAFFQAQPSLSVTVDPLRLVNAIVVGISFLGAGTIIKSRQEKSVEGLTTSASILAVSAIGIAVALDVYYLAIGVTVLNVLVNWGVISIANVVNPNRSIK